MRSIKSQIKQMELSNAIQTGRSSRVARVGDEKNSKGLMQNGSMGVGSLGVARGDMAVWGRSTFHLLSSDRTKTQTYLDQWNLEDLKGKSPRQVKNCLGGYGKEDEAEAFGRQMCRRRMSWSQLQHGISLALRANHSIECNSLLIQSGAPAPSKYRGKSGPQCLKSATKGLLYLWIFPCFEKIAAFRGNRYVKSTTVH